MRLSGFSRRVALLAGAGLGVSLIAPFRGWVTDQKTLCDEFHQDAKSSLTQRDSGKPSEKLRTSFKKVPFQSNSMNEYPSSLKLVSVHLVHRHGARTVVRNRFTDILKGEWECNPKQGNIEAIHHPVSGELPLTGSRYQIIYANGGLSGNCYIGQLTPVGKKQMFELGTCIRNLYIDHMKFLPDIYDPKLVKIRSTDVQRTIQSVQNFMFGLYNDQKRHPDQSSIVPINILPIHAENMFPRGGCRKTSLIKANLKKSEAYSKVLADFEPFQKQIAAFLQCPTSALPSIHGIYDEFVARLTNQMPLPTAVDENVMDLLEVFTVRYFFGMALQSSDLVRLGIGRFVRDFVEDILKSSRRENSHKLSIFSGHDTTLALLLMSMGVFDMKWPLYGSTVIVELFDSTELDFSSRNPKPKQFIRLLYNNVPLVIPACGKEFCPLESFLDLTSTMIPENYEQECGS